VQKAVRVAPDLRGPLASDLLQDLNAGYLAKRTITHGPTQKYSQTIWRVARTFEKACNAIGLGSDGNKGRVLSAKKLDRAVKLLSQKLSTLRVGESNAYWARAQFSVPRIVSERGNHLLSPPDHVLAHLQPSEEIRGHTRLSGWKWKAKLKPINLIEISNGTVILPKEGKLSHTDMELGVGLQAQEGETEHESPESALARYEELERSYNEIFQRSDDAVRRSELPLEKLEYKDRVDYSLTRESAANKYCQFYEWTPKVKEVFDCFFESKMTQRDLRETCDIMSLNKLTASQRELLLDLFKRLVVPANWFDDMT